MKKDFGFDGSSIRGWQPIHASDMLVIPDPTTAVMDPFMQHPTLSLICNIVDPVTKERYTRDPRNIAQQSRSLPEVHKDRRHGLFWTGGRILHF